MQAFTPTPPPTPEHLALITEALCARAKARNQAANVSTLKRRVQFQQELSLLRVSSNPNPNTTRLHTENNPTPLGAAAVLHARLNRINPQPLQEHHVQTHHVQTYPEMTDQSRVDAYNARMNKYFHVTKVSASTSRASVRETSGYTQPKPLDVEHVLPAAPVRPEIPSARVVPMITAHAEEDVKKNHVEEVQRPSLVDAVVRAFSKFVDRFSEKKENKDRDKEADAVALGTAAVQVLAMFTSLGKH